MPENLDKLTSMSIRRRLSPDESRMAALVAARELLIEEGPQAVTLKAVATRIGRTHANLLHHFGTAADLQKALASHHAQEICATIAAAVMAHRAGVGPARAIVDLTFDAFDSGGGGALASWMLLSGNRDALDPIVDAIHDLVQELDTTGTGALRETTLVLVLMALGNAQLGGPLAHALQLPRETVRDAAERMLLAAAANAGVV